MEKDWINIYSSTDLIKVKILNHLLSEKNIKSVIINNQDSSYLMFGRINLYVNKNNLEIAKEILKKEYYEE